jgi:hypothetical protein
MPPGWFDALRTVSIRTSSFFNAQVCWDPYFALADVSGFFPVFPRGTWCWTLSLEDLLPITRATRTSVVVDTVAHVNQHPQLC